jgi:hypothetical protein
LKRSTWTLTSKLGFFGKQIRSRYLYEKDDFHTGKFDMSENFTINGKMALFIINKYPTPRFGPFRSFARSALRVQSSPPVIGFYRALVECKLRQVLRGLEKTVIAVERVQTNVERIMQTEIEVLLWPRELREQRASQVAGVCPSKPDTFSSRSNCSSVSY